MRDALQETGAKPRTPRGAQGFWPRALGPGARAAQYYTARSPPLSEKPPRRPGDWERRAEPLGGQAPSGLTPPPHQPRLLREPGPGPQRRPGGRLFSGRGSRLDAFSGYPLRRGCPALPCRTTGTLEAAAPRSSRTRGTFPSGGPHPPRVESDLSHDGLNPAHVPL